MEGVCVFIDGANFYYQCKDNLGRTDVDFGAFAGLLVGPSRTLVRTYYYTCRLTPDHSVEMRKAQERFLGALDHVDYLEVRLGKLVRRDTTCNACGVVEEKWIEKGVDMRLGVDMLAAAAKDMYETAGLVSGDGDIAEAVRAVEGSRSARGGRCVREEPITRPRIGLRCLPRSDGFRAEAIASPWPRIWQAAERIVRDPAF